MDGLIGGEHEKEDGCLKSHTTGFSCSVPWNVC